MKYIDTNRRIVAADSKPAPPDLAGSVTDCVGSFPAPEDAWDWGEWVTYAYPALEIES